MHLLFVFFDGASSFLLEIFFKTVYEFYIVCLFYTVPGEILVLISEKIKNMKRFVTM